MTQQSLLPQDPGSYDLYDAREGGGFPVPAVAVPCSEEGCQGKVPAPSSPTPMSNQAGPGNPKAKPVKCKKGTHKVTKHGKRRCVANKPQAHKNHKRSKNHKSGRTRR